MSGPYEVTKQLEAELCSYTGAKYAVAVNSGSAALLLAAQYHMPVRLDHPKIIERRSFIRIPARTYVSVPMAIIHAGGWPVFHDIKWKGEYQLEPLPVWDSACRFTSGMYRNGQFQCVSFAARKILGIEQGGAILHDNEEADGWLRRMRFDGRAEGIEPKDDTFGFAGWHCIMIPSVAAALKLQLYHLPKVNEDQVYEYPDLSKHKAFA